MSYYYTFMNELRIAADYFEKKHPDLPDVISTYRIAATIIEELLYINEIVEHMAEECE